MGTRNGSREGVERLQDVIGSLSRSAAMTDARFQFVQLFDAGRTSSVIGKPFDDVGRQIGRAVFAGEILGEQDFISAGLAGFVA